MRKIIPRRSDSNILLENKEYKNLHLFVYILTTLLIVIIYYISITFFSQYVSFLITSAASILIAIYLIYKRDAILKSISLYIHEKKRIAYVREQELGHKKSMKRIVPKKRINLHIHAKEALKDKLIKLKNKITGKKTNPNKEYIEIKE